MAISDLIIEPYYPPAPPNSPTEPSSLLSFPVLSISPTSSTPIFSETASQTINNNSDDHAATAMNPSLTPLERSRQARNKDVNERPSKPSPSKGKKKTSDATDKTADGKGPKTDNERYEEQERMYTAARVLDSTELLIFHAHANNESIPQTRLRFEKMLIGIEDSSDEWEECLEDDDGPGESPGAPRNQKGPDKGEGSKKRAAR